jgi:hypothetical protein
VLYLVDYINVIQIYNTNSSKFEKNYVICFVLWIEQVNGTLCDDYSSNTEITERQAV